MLVQKLKGHFCVAFEQALNTMRLKKGAKWMDVKDSYTYLQKRYHPDVNKEEGASESLERIKHINIAYKILEEYYRTRGLKIETREQNNNDAKTYAQYSVWKGKTEADLYEEIFRHYFGTNDKAELEKVENTAKRALFETDYKNAVDILQGKQKGSFLDEEYWKDQQYEGSGDFYFKEGFEQPKQGQSFQKQGDESPLTNSSTIYKISLGAFSLLVLGMGGYVLLSENNDPFKGKLNAAKIESIRQKALDYRVSEKQKLIDEAVYSQNTMKSWPVGKKSSNSMEQLIDYTIYGDLKIYRVESGYFYRDLDEMTFMDPREVRKVPLTGIRMNHMVSLALEAERSLQNVFIKAEDLKRQVRENGYYECPGIFLRYKGFVYFRTRHKPIVLADIESIPNNQTVSLFEIFHRYSSPIPEVFDQYYEEKLTHGGYIEDTTTLENSSWIGNITFNHRSIPQLLIKGDERNVFVWRGRSQDDPLEKRYIALWDRLYPQTTEEAAIAAALVKGNQQKQN